MVFSLVRRVCLCSKLNVRWWQCVNSNGDTVAWYALGVPGEVYESSSGRAFGVEELYLHLTVGKQALRASPFELGLITNRWLCQNSSLRCSSCDILRPWTREGLLSSLQV